MVELRIYRMGLVPVALAVILFAFSLANQQSALSSTLAPDAFAGQNAYGAMNELARDYPDRRPGSAADGRLADYLAAQLSRQDRFAVTRDYFSARTPDGSRVLETVVGSRAGLVPGTIAIVTSRDSPDLSGTGVMLELAGLLSGETQHHTVVLASISGSVGGVGAAELARELPRPVDAVIVLGDLAGRTVSQPVVVPWSSGQRVAPTMLRNTLASAISAQAGISAQNNGLGGQIAHLAFPITSSTQAPFGSSGYPAVLVSVSGEQRVAAKRRTSLARITGMGKAILVALGALDNGPAVGAPSPYLEWSGKVVPDWAFRLLVLALIAPVAAAAVDAVARARRRGFPVLRAAGWVLAAAIPFLGAALLVALARLVGLIGFAPTVAVAGGEVPLHASGVAVLVLVACVLLAGVVLVRPAAAAVAGFGEAASELEPRGGAGTALLAVLSVIAVVVWIANPFAALLIVPGLHLWMWLVAGRHRLPTAVALVLFVGGLVLPALVALYCAVVLDVGPVGLAWSWILLLAGGAVGWATALEWALFAGCALSAAAIALRVTRAPAPETIPITIRGPITYAGPGSLGGTGSAMRR